MLKIKKSPVKKEEPQAEVRGPEEPQAMLLTANRRHSEVDLLDSKRRTEPPSDSSPLDSQVESRPEAPSKTPEMLVSVVE